MIIPNSEHSVVFKRFQVSLTLCVGFDAQLGLCTGMTNAHYRTTTEVYPDSDRVPPGQCNAAQVAAVCAAIDYALSEYNG